MTRGKEDLIPFYYLKISALIVEPDRNVAFLLDRKCSGQYCGESGAHRDYRENIIGRSYLEATQRLTLNTSAAVPSSATSSQSPDARRRLGESLCGRRQAWYWSHHHSIQISRLNRLLAASFSRATPIRVAHSVPSRCASRQ